MAYDRTALARYARKHPYHRRYEEIRKAYGLSGEAVPVEWRTINYFEDWARKVRLGRHDRLSPASGALISPDNYRIEQTRANAERLGMDRPRVAIMERSIDK